MKKLFMVAMSLIIACGFSCAQDLKQVKKERKMLQKYSKKELSEKASKEARKEARKLTKEGYKVFAGDLPLAKQLDRSYMMEYEFMAGPSGPIQKYLVGRGKATGESYSAAQHAALELAKLYVASLAESEILSMTDATLGNNETHVVTSLAKVVTASKNIVCTRLGEVVPVVTIYKEPKKHEVTVLVRLVYDRNAVLQTYKTVIREELEKKGDELHDRLDQLLGF
jgi:hypothetical protein